MADKAEVARKLDETVAGGYFIGTDGKPHDADGKPVKGVSESDVAAAQEEAAAGTGNATGGPATTGEGDVQYASAAAADAAEKAGLTAADFADQEPSSENGFTKADVTAIIDAKSGE